MSKRLRNLCSDESGSIIVFVLIFLPILLGMVAWSFNYGFRNLIANRLQITADMAALAGASGLPNPVVVTARANTYAEQNMSAAIFDDVVLDGDIVLGNWDRDTRTFVAALEPLNAVRIIARRSAANANPNSVFLAGLMGLPNQINVEMAGIAWSTVADCFSNGFIGEGVVDIQNTNTLTGFCMRGNEGMRIQGDNTFDEDSVVSILEAGTRLGYDFAESEPNLGYCDAQGYIPNDEAREIAGAEAVVDDMVAYYNLPDFLTPANQQIVSTAFAGPFVPGTFYHISNGDDFTIKSDISNVGIYSEKEINTDSGLVFQNVVLISDGDINFGSDTQIGAIAYGESLPNPLLCADISGGVFIASKTNVTFQSNNAISGMQVIAGGDFTMQSNNKVFGAAAVQAEGDVTVQSSGFYQACNTNNEHVLVPAGGLILVLVD